jgi:hypothetical protein
MTCVKNNCEGARSSGTSGADSGWAPRVGHSLRRKKDRTLSIRTSTGLLGFRIHS